MPSLQKKILDRVAKDQKKMGGDLAYWMDSRIFLEELGKVAQKIREMKGIVLVDEEGDDKDVLIERKRILGLLVDSGTLETLKIMEDKKLMKLLTEARKKGSKSSPYKLLVEQEGEKR